MTDFSIFEDHHLTAAEARYAGDYRVSAEKGLLSLAETSHISLLAVRAELERRAVANLRKSEAA